MYPILFEFGSVTIYSLWFFVTAGFIIGSLTFTHLCKRNRVNIELFTNHAFLIFLVSLFCGRMTFVVTHSELFFFNYDLREWLGLLGLWDKGISFWGSLVGFLLILTLLRHKTDESLAALFDQLAPAVIIGMAITSFGAFLDGSLYGSPSNVPWAITFKSAYVKYITPIHPTQLYMLFFESLIAIILLRMLNRLRNSSIQGLAAEVGLTTMSLVIFIVDFVRGDEAQKIAGMRISHIIAAITFGTGVYLLMRRIKNPQRFDPDNVFTSLFPRTTRLLKKLHLLQSSQLPE